MEGFNNPNGGSFEDQFRQMVLNPGPQKIPENVDPQSRPTVRLPPSQIQNSLPQRGNYGSNYRGGHNNHGNFTQHAPPGHAYPTGPPMQTPMNYPRPPGLGPIERVSAGRGRGAYLANRHHQARQNFPLDPTAFRRGNYQPHGGQHQPYNHRSQGYQPAAMTGEQHTRRTLHVDEIVQKEVPAVEMSQAERDEKLAFRAVLQSAIHEVCAANPERLPQITLECFGSFQSGFASADSDMDLVIVMQDEQRAPACFSLDEDDLPRALEKKLLDKRLGARLLTRTRVPIIKICEKPTENLLTMLREERKKWDALPEKEKYPHLFPQEEAPPADTKEGAQEVPQPDQQTPVAETKEPTPVEEPVPATEGDPTTEPKPDAQAPRMRRDKPWTRERKSGPLDFPKDGIGIQSDINFFNPLGLSNTQMLRCYSSSDPRVRPMVLFVKAWAKQRKINSSYSGTLSSYGYVLMVLHFLINVAQPPVLSNLQLPWRPNPQCTPHGATRTEVDGWTVDFWRNEEEIIQAVQNGQMSPNKESLGSLLVGFFYYYSSAGGFPQFHWMKDVLSLRVEGGLQTKEDKGWTKAVTEEGEGKKVQHRYLFCIEDPFELSHNVARTVTHNGIVAIRDEFRRAKRILQAIGIGATPYDGELFAELVEDEETQNQTAPPRQQHHPTTGVDGAPHPEHQQQQGRQQFRGPPSHAHHQNNNHHHAGPHPNSRSINVMDNDAFPTLGGPRSNNSTPRPSNRGNHTASRGRGGKKTIPETDLHTSEISGARAQQYLDDLKLKKIESADSDEKQAESTAMGAAESVLNGFD